MKKWGFKSEKMVGQTGVEPATFRPPVDTSVFS